MPETLVSRFIRIHPADHRKGYRVARYLIMAKLFLEEIGWYFCAFSEDQWDILREARVNNENPDSPPVFDICTEAEKQQIDRREHKRKALAAMGLSESDLPDSAADRTATAAEPAPKRRPGRPRKSVPADGFEPLG